MSSGLIILYWYKVKVLMYWEQIKILGNGDYCLLLLDYII